MRHIAIFRSEGPNWVQGKGVREQPYWDEHAAFMDALFDSGAVYLAGPFAEGGSMVIYNAESVEAAVAMQQDDPWLLRGIHTDAGAREWTIFLDAREKQSG
jgi:uncharacterized protein YciI